MEAEEREEYRKAYNESQNQYGKFILWGQEHIMTKEERKELDNLWEKRKELMLKILYDRRNKEIEEAVKAGAKYNEVLEIVKRYESKIIKIIL